MKTQDGRLHVISGASRCGKSTYVARQVRKVSRALAYDPEAQWCDEPGFIKVTTRHQLLTLAKRRGPLKVAFVPGADLKGDFDFCCGVAMAVGRHIEPLDFIAEELADVTTPSKAPGHWGILVRRGLKRGISIWAISQRWAEADKTAMGNASRYVLFASRGEDIAYISRKTTVPIEELSALKAFEFVEFDPVTKEKAKRRLAFKK